jgi:excinuclease UvrABC ATPase subunit
MTERKSIFIKGAREHNLKNIDIEIPRDKLIVITGLSGSGKSSLAFDTIYAEGQRRYVESLSAYARQFLGLMEKPDVDYIEGLSPAISIEQRSASKNPRSTVGTVTEIYDYLRLMFARIGKAHCPECNFRDSLIRYTAREFQAIERISKVVSSLKRFLVADASAYSSDSNTISLSTNFSRDSASTSNKISRLILYSPAIFQRPIFIQKLYLILKFRN